MVDIHYFILATFPHGGFILSLFITHKTGIFIEADFLGKVAYPSVRIIILAGLSNILFFIYEKMTLKFAYFHFDSIRIIFRNILVNKIKAHYKEHYPKESTKMVTFLNKLIKDNPKGFYVYGPQLEKESTLKDTKSLTNYIARYAAHPPISEKRIISIDYQTNKIKWYYDPHEDDDIEDEEKKLGRQIIEEDVFEFIKRLIVHIPTKNFNQIRYYGFYSNKCKMKISNNSLFTIEELNKMKENTLWINDLKKSYGYSPILCYCGYEMILNEELSFYPGEKRNE